MSPSDTATTGRAHHPGARHLADYWLTVVRRTWQGGVVSGFLTPLLYIVAMGVLLGGFIKGDPAKLEGATSYLAFIAPGMVASQAMITVFGELTYPVMGMIKWQRTYDGMLATPLRVRDVVNAQLGYVLARVFVICLFFMLVMAPFGVFRSWWGVVLALPVQVLVAAAFATPVFAFSATVRNDAFFALIFRLAMMPMFLFSGAFFPVSNLSAPLEFLAKLTPLWHGVDLTRMLVLGTLQTGPALLHLACLGTLAAIFWWLTIRQLQRRLIT